MKTRRLVARATTISGERRGLIKASGLGLLATLCGRPAWAATPVPPQLAALRAWLKKHLPSVAASLNPGASDAQLDLLEKAIGQPLPEDFRVLYRWHNGQSPRAGTGPWYGLNFLSLDEVIDNWKVHADIIDHADRSDPFNFNESAMPGVVKAVYLDKGWIPFAHDWGGNFLGIDLEPDVNGVRGQVINFGRDEDRKYAIAPNLTAFVHWMVGELNRGNYSITRNEDGLPIFNTRWPQTEHFLDSITTLFPSVPRPRPEPAPRPSCDLPPVAS